METVNLSAAGDDEVKFNKKLCIICQEHIQDKLASTQHGCDQISDLLNAFDIGKKI